MRKMIKGEEHIKIIELCEDCKKRESVLTYSAEPMLTLTHGWGGRHICRQCLIKRIKSHIKDCQKQLQDEMELLKNEKKNEKT
jgi:hypothetical protein